MQPLDVSLSPMTPRDQNQEYVEINPEYKGEKLKPEWANGPTDDRGCTDFLCCILFAAFMAGFGFIAYLGFSHGNPQLLTAPFDSTGQQCGISPGYLQYKYVYFNQLNTSQFCCINSCPQPYLDSSSLCWFNNSAFACTNFGNYSTVKTVDICYPQDSDTAETIELALGIFEMMVSDIELVWPISLSVAGMAFILSIIMLLIIRQFGGCIVWGVLFLYFVGLTSFGFVSYFMAGKLSSESGLNNPETFKIIAYACWAVVALSLLILACTFKKLKIAVILIKAAADFTRKNFYLIIVPVLLFCLASLFIAFWMYDSIYLYSTGTPKSCGDSPYSCVHWNQTIRSLLIYNFFALFWVCQFIISLSQYIISSTAALWYFSHVNHDHKSRPLCRSLSRAFFYHIGSLAFGALVLAIVIILQIFMSLFHWIMKETTMKNKNSTNGCMKCCMGCSSCCISCFERFMRFLTRSSFIMMAVTGESFCRSAHHAFYLSIRIVETYAITNGVCHLVMIFSKLLVTTACTVAGFYMITGIVEFKENLFQPVLPCVMFVVISYVISSLFMDVLGISADTLLYCYSIELDIHGGSVKSCPPGLMEFIQQYR